MDKVKIALALLKKHHFWVMSGTVVLLGLVGWFMATSKLWAEYQIHKATIEGKFKDLNKIKGEERENQTWIDELDKETAQLKSQVRIAWDLVYTEQKDHVLKWPASLGPETVKELERLGPNDPIRLPVREHYQNYIRERISAAAENRRMPGLSRQRPTRSPGEKNGRWAGGRSRLQGDLGRDESKGN